MATAEGEDGRRGPSPTALEVVRRHLRAVERLDAAAMADDYAEDAVVRRGDDQHRGRAEIAAYFATVPGRLAGARVQVGDVAVDGPTAGGGAPGQRVTGRVVVRWRIVRGDGTAPDSGTTGTDTYDVAGGLIVAQQVVLDGEDF